VAADAETQRGEHVVLEVVVAPRGEALAVGPHRVVRSETEMPLPERVATGAIAMGVPGLPELACCTASIESVRIVSTQS